MRRHGNVNRKVRNLRIADIGPVEEADEVQQAEL